MPSSQEAETEDQTEEHDNKRNVDSQRSTQKDKGNQGHYNIIMPLNCIIQLRQSARLSPRRIRRNNSMKSVVHVTEIHPVAAVDYEYGHREWVPEDEFCDSGDDHGDAAKEVEGSGDPSDGGGFAALELEEAEDGGGEGNKKANDTNKCGVSCCEGR